MVPECEVLIIRDEDEESLIDSTLSGVVMVDSTLPYHKLYLKTCES